MNETQPTKATLVFLLRDEEVLLAMKKRRYGEGKWNGVGGKIDPGESVEEAAIRETQEEIGVTPKNLRKMAHLQFFVLKEDVRVPEMDVQVFSAVEWDGEPQESEEMAPKWFDKNNLPYSSMWPDDEYWLPAMLDGKLQQGTFVFDENYVIIDHTLSEVTSLE